MAVRAELIMMDASIPIEEIWVTSLHPELDKHPKLDWLGYGHFEAFGDNRVMVMDADSYYAQNQLNTRASTLLGQSVDCNVAVLDAQDFDDLFMGRARASSSERSPPLKIPDLPAGDPLLHQSLE